ncbi:phosphatase PAP2 family protein [Aurantiacibacter flavus]|uniref:Phosphatase PAP2 family protein n=1 Tax=Aurantiacibacter flavus TaxID=3145232 RepID=A0ABV0CWQ1_9SPHN
MREKEWLLPSIVLTIVTATAALTLIPSVSGLLPALAILPAWMAGAFAISTIFGFVWMALHGVKRPAAEAVAYLSREKRKLLFVALVMLLAGMNMVSFMWVKPLLNYLVPFWADPLLAKWDAILFLGHDPWQTLGWLSFPNAGLVYHPIWFLLMIGSLLIAAFAPFSSNRSAILLSYFALWSVVGPLIHSILPAAGPIFYERMGYGPRFEGLDGGPETVAVADYLWSIYANESFGAGSGISAMPSMHVTMSSWIVIVFFVFARRWLPIAIAAWLTMFALSIALGWHYALDGIVGAIAAVVCYLALAKLFRTKAKGGLDFRLTALAPNSTLQSRQE